MARRNLERHESRGPHNSLWYFAKDIGYLRLFWNWLCTFPAKLSPSFRLKNVLYRMAGAKVGKHVSIGYNAQFDVIFPHLIEIHDDAIVGYGTTILCHEYLNREYRTGKVVVGKGATVGANCLILPGVTIGEGAVVSGMSLVNSDVPAGAFYGGVPARELKRREPIRVRTRKG